MRIAPLAWDLLAGVATSTDAKACWKGLPDANLTNLDLRRPAITRGTWTVATGVNDALDVDEGGGELTATIAAGTYYGPGAYGAAVMAALDAVGAAWQAFQLHGSSDRHKWLLRPPSGTAELLCGTGTNVATSAWADLGYRAEDRAAAATHTGDFAAISGTGGDRLLYDLGSAKPAQMAALVRPYLSPGARPVRRFGTTSAVSSASATFGDWDSELMVAFFGSTLEYRHVRLDLVDPRRHDIPETGACLAYLGRYWEPETNWEWSGYSRQGQQLTRTQAGIEGHPFLSELAAGERFSLKWGSDPGMPDQDWQTLAGLITTLGLNGYALVAMDPENEPTRETRVCRVQQMPTVERVLRDSAAGRWTVSMELEVVPVS